MTITRISAAKWAVAKSADWVNFVDMKREDLLKCVDALPTILRNVMERGAVRRGVQGVGIARSSYRWFWESWRGYWDNWNAGFIAGGFVRDVIRGVEWKDVDFFPEPQRNIEKCLLCAGRVCREVKGDEFGKTGNAEQDTYALTFKCLPWLQVIREPEFLAQTLPQLLRRFDAHINMAGIGYDAKVGWYGMVSSEFYHDLESSRVTIVNMPLYPWRRVDRWRELGFEVPDEFVVGLVGSALIGDEYQDLPSKIARRIR